MKKSFDQKWGGKILIGVIVFITLYSFAPVVFGAWEEYYKTMDDSSGDKYKDNGQNLYYYVYDKVKVEPAMAALEDTAVYFGYGTSDSNLDYVISIVDVDNGKGIFGADPMTAFDAEASEYEETEDLSTIQGRYEKSMAMKTYFYKALSDESFKNELAVQTETNEMYANGDTSDSGFDIIVDLKTIEYILFASVTDTWTGDDGDLSDDEADDEDGLTRSAEEDSTDESDIVQATTATTDTDTAATPIESAETASGDVASEISESKLECFSNDDLSDAIADFQDEISGSGTVPGSDDGEDDDGSEGDSGDGGASGGGSKNIEPTSEDNFYSSLEGPSSADWSRELPCEDILCLEVNFVTGDDEDYPYQETDNCIACHISYIKQTLEDVTSHDLSPSKVTGSMMEDASCKASFSALIPSFGVFVLTNPILTPPNDDIVVSVGNIVQNLKESLYPNTTTGDVASDYSSLTDKYTALVQNTYGTTSLVNNTDEILALVSEELEARIQALTEYSISTQLSDMNTMYQALSYEMVQTNSFFKSIQSLLLDSQVYLDAIAKKDYVQ